MLTNKQIRHLRALAHSLNFIVQTCEKGLSEAVQNEINIALEAHELSKVKRNDKRSERNAMIDSIISTKKCELIQHIVKTVVRFRRNRDSNKIELPKP